MEGSLRRSTRRSVKPLDWWRNEKAVYERRFKSASLHCHTPLCMSHLIEQEPRLCFDNVAATAQAVLTVHIGMKMTQT